jgi:hypothetical protein
VDSWGWKLAANPATNRVYVGQYDKETLLVIEDPSNLPPAADPDGPYVGMVGDPMTFDGSGSFDPAGTMISYDWDFGDGNAGAGVSPSHTYGAEGVYTVSLTVTDDGGATANGTTTADVHAIKVEEAALQAKEYRWGDPVPGFSFAEWPMFEGWMNVRIENHGLGDAFNVTATVTDWPANVEVPDPNVVVGDIPAGNSAWSVDTFTTRVDMANPVDACEGVVWRIEYDDAIGVHHVVENIPEFHPGEGPCP